MQGTARALGHFEAPAVLKRRNFSSRRLYFGRIDAGEDHAGLAAAFGKNFAPWIDDERMSESLAAVLVTASLRRGKHECPVLDGARTVEHVPMRRAGLSGEGRGDGEECAAGFRERAVKRGEAQIITDGEPEPAPRQVCGDRDFSRPIIA